MATNPVNPDPVVAPEARKSLTVEIGRSGTFNFGGILQPEEYNPKLVPPLSFQIYDRMALSDPVTHATLQHITTPLLAAEWKTKPASKEPIDLEKAALVHYAMHEWMDVTWGDCLVDQMKYLRWGNAVLEGVYKHDRRSWQYQDGADTVTVPERDVFVWKKWAPRLPRTIQRWIVEGTDLVAIEQMAIGTDGQWLGQSNLVEIPRDKCLVLVNEKTGDDWWGTSLLRAAYKPWWLLENVQRVAAIGFERFLVGTPMARMNPNATPAQRASMMNALMALRSSEAAAMTYSEEDGVDCGDESKAGSINRAIWVLQPERDPPDALPFMQSLESNIFTNILARFMDLGQKETGARATAEVQRDPFYLGLIAIANQIATEWNRGPVKKLIDLNYPGTSVYPKIEVTGITPQDIPIIARAAQMWAQFGFITPDAETESWIREQLPGMPAKDFSSEEELRYAASKATQARIGPLAGGAHGDQGGASGTAGVTGGTGAREGGDTDSSTGLSEGVALADQSWQPGRPFVPTSDTSTGTPPAT